MKKIKWTNAIARLFNNEASRYEYPLNYDEPYPNDPIVFEYGYGLASIVEEDMAESIEATRQKLLEELGIEIPPILLYQNKRLHPNEYTFKLWGIQVSDNEILLDHLFAIETENTVGKISGIPTFTPCYNAPALWITKEQTEMAEKKGYLVVDEITMIEMHLEEILRIFLPTDVGRLWGKEVKEPLLCKGIFWITDMYNVERNQMIYRIPIDCMGNIDDSVDRNGLNSKKHDNFNHEKTWKSLNTRITRRKRFDYYPRGRVEVSGGKAIIFASPWICREGIIDFIVDRFELTEENGIQKVVVMPDYSEHYKCYLDR